MIFHSLGRHPLAGLAAALLRCLLEATALTY